MQRLLVDLISFVLYIGQCTRFGYLAPKINAHDASSGATVQVLFLPGQNLYLYPYFAYASELWLIEKQPNIVHWPRSFLPCILSSGPFVA